MKERRGKNEETKKEIETKERNLIDPSSRQIFIFLCEEIVERSHSMLNQELMPVVQTHGYRKIGFHYSSVQ